MNYGLTRAAEQLKEDAAKYGVEVLASKGLIVYDNHVLKMEPFATEADCRRQINQFINIAKEKRQMELNARQISLLV